MPTCPRIGRVPLAANRVPERCEASDFVDLLILSILTRDIQVFYTFTLLYSCAIGFSFLESHFLFQANRSIHGNPIASIPKRHLGNRLVGSMWSRRRVCLCNSCPGHSEGTCDRFIYVRALPICHQQSPRDEPS